MVLNLHISPARAFFVLMILPSLVLGAPAETPMVPVWYQTPFRIQAGGEFIDGAETFGHAGPAFADVDGDGKRDLVVGTFDGGQFRYYRNVGTDAAPAFNKEYAWLMAGDHVAQVPIYCCVAASPVIADIDQDGIADLVSGSYDPGAIYWFKGRGKGQFETRQMLTDSVGVPILSHIETIKTDIGQSLCSIPSLVDWNADGLLDLVFGNNDGEVFLRLSEGTEKRVPGYTALPSQPVFSGLHKELHFKTRSNMLPYGEKHAAPVAVDWDGDGLLDLLVGSYSGAVYLLRNSGTAKEPMFDTREHLLPPGLGDDQWAKQGHAPKRGIRSQIQVVDYNRDGKLDLLVSDWANTITPRPDLTRAERVELKKLVQQLASIDAEVGYDAILPRSYDKQYEENKVFAKRAQEVEKQMQRYLVTRKFSEDYETATQNHGYIWVYLRN
jgi:hypothetical protein